jgi:hypothetical protein
LVELSEDDERIRPSWAYENDFKKNVILGVEVVEPVVEGHVDN